VQEQILRQTVRTQADLDALRTDWRYVGRPNQQPPAGAWRTWLLLAGRGFGKTRTGAEWVRAQVQAGRSRIALVAPTAADARDVVVEGESGLLAVCRRAGQEPTYEPSKRRITWPSGAMATTYSADEPDRLRGPQHDAAWCDELAAWRYPEAWDMLRFGLRLGDDPRTIVTTTPRPTALMRDLIGAPDTVTTRGSTYDNASNLSASFIAAIRARYEGTRLGRQELHAELLDDVPGALWTRALLDDALARSSTPTLVRVIVAIDPAVTSSNDSDETGIIVAGVDDAGIGHVLEDLSGRLSPDAWARRAVDAYRRHRADRVVAEVNNGGDLVETVLRTLNQDVSYRAVRASRGKHARAEPVAALYEQGRVRHAAGLDRLEDQMATWVPGHDSPDRLDALVWALTDLMITTSEWFVA
jgi:predicted phage terminase large subunit-like protein